MIQDDSFIILVIPQIKHNIIDCHAIGNVIIGMEYRFSRNGLLDILMFFLTGNSCDVQNRVPFTAEGSHNVPQDGTARFALKQVVVCNFTSTFSNMVMAKYQTGNFLLQ